MRIAAGLMLLGAGAAGCAHDGQVRNGVLASPGNHLGRLVQVCGHRVEPGNLIDRPRFAAGVRGLSIIDSGPLEPLHVGPVCVEGVIEYVGCRTGEVICLDWGFDYGIRIRRVLR